MVKDVELTYIILVLALIVLAYLLYVNVRAISKSKIVRAYLEPVSELDHIGFQMLDKVTSELYFNKKEAVFVVSVSASKNGIHLYSPNKISVCIPWTRLSAIRLVVLNGSLLANLRILKDGTVDRKLTVPWKEGFNVKVPSHIVLVQDM